MCGIGGIWNPTKNIENHELAHQLESIQHRGPDGYGIIKKEHIGLVHARLAIQDLKETGKQPLVSDQNCLVFNGEIYNFPELKNYLRSKYQCRFLGSGDAEVLFQGLILEGTDFIHRLIGDFAIIWWKGSERKLYLIRDRLGVKPLYYRRTDSRFFVSSEIRGVFAKGESRKIETKSLNSLLALRYVRGDKTIFQDVQRVPPGHYLVVDENFSVKMVQYWDPFRSGVSWSYSEMIYLLESSIKMRLRSKVDIGLLLSGGMDSTLIAKLANQMSERPLKSFTCRFDHSIPSKLDSLRAEQFARAQGFSHQIYNHTEESYHEALVAIEEPIGDAIVSPLYGLIKGARQHVKVLFSGEGADEIFAGYGHHYFFRLNSCWPRPIKEGVATLLPFLSQVFSRSFRRLYPAQLGTEEVFRLQVALRTSSNFSKLYHTVCDVFSEDQRRVMLGAHFEDLESETESILQTLPTRSFLKRLLYLEMKSWLCNYNLLKLDKIAGWHGMEVRVPYLDHRLVEQVFAAPEELLMGIFERKPLMKSLCQTFQIPQPEKIPFIYLKDKNPQSIFTEKFTTLPITLEQRSMQESSFLSKKRVDLLNILNVWEKQENIK